MRYDHPLQEKVDLLEHEKRELLAEIKRLQTELVAAKDRVITRYLTSEPEIDPHV